MSSYSSIDGVLYCKPHYDQLFKETGNFTKKLQSCEIPLFVFLMFNSFTCFWNWFSTEKDVVLPILPFLWALTMCFCILAVSGREEKWPGTKIAHNCFFFITLLLFLTEISRLFAEVWCMLSQLRRQRPQANSLPCSLAPRTNVHPVKKLYTH